MKTSIQQEKLILAFMLKYPKYLENVHKDFFQNQELQFIALTAKNFFNEYAESPSSDQMKAIIKGMDGKEEFDMSVVDTVYDVDIMSYEYEWIKDTSEKWIKWRAFNTNVMKAASHAKLTDVSLENVDDVLHTCMDILNSTNSVNFDDDLGVDFFDPENHKSVLQNKVPYTWEHFNSWTHGGLDPKTLMCYIGGTNVGKSVILCNDAAEFVRKGKNTIYITCEMSPEKVNRRIAANMCDITLEEYDTLVESQDRVRKKLKALSNNSLVPMGRLFVKQFATGEGTSLDVENYINEIEKIMKFKVDVVIIDYINIMKNHQLPNTENTYLKIKGLAEQLRAIAVKHDLIVITATQCGRSALNSSDMSMEDVSESMGLLHTVDYSIGLIQTEEMRLGAGSEEDDNDDTDGMPWYWFKMLKVREGEGRDLKFKVTANYNKMKLFEKTDVIDTNSHMK